MLIRKRLWRLTRESLSHLRVLGKVSAISLILLLISLTIFAEAEEEAVVMVEGFRYEEKVYDGVRGPGGIWY